MSDKLPFWITGSFWGTLTLGCLTLPSCSSADDNSVATPATKARLLDRVTPTENARARRVGLGDGEKVFFTVDMDGRRFSSGNTVRSRSTYNGVAAIVTETQQNYDLMTASNQRLQQFSYRKTIADAATGESLYLTENVDRDGASATRMITIDRGRALFRTLDNPDENDEVAVPKGILFAVTPDWILAQKPQVGKTYRASVLDRENKTVINEDVTVRDFSPSSVMGVTLNLWTADIIRDASPSTRIMFTAAGDLISMHSDNLTLQATPAREATLDYAKMETARSLPISFQLPAWDNFNSLTYRPQPADRWRDLLVVDPNYQNFVNGELKLSKNTPAIGAATFPLDVPANLLNFCRRGANIFPDEREISDLARGIVGNEKRVVPAVAAIAGWIYQTIALDKYESDDTPLGTLQRKTGDALRHARLFASLARSLNIPTRLCEGLLIQRDHATRHTWCEVNIGGQWLPIDTTVNRVGLPAGYILTEVEADGSGELSHKFAWTLRDGGLGLEFVSAIKTYNTPDGRAVDFELFPDSKKTYVAVEKNWIANLYWGFSLVKPENWTGNINLQAITVASADNEAVVKIEALNKVFPCSRGQLDMLLGTLRTTLPDFKLLSSDLVRFGSRHNAAMFADFTATQDGNSRRCQMYVIPLRGRSYRVMAWAGANNFSEWQKPLSEILASIGM